jgi:hypothetical protein
MKSKTSTPPTHFNPPKDPSLHAIWIIRNWTQMPKGNLETYEEIVAKVNRLASEVLNECNRSER